MTTEQNSARYEAMKRLKMMSDEDSDSVEGIMSAHDDDTDDYPRTDEEFDALSDRLISALAEFDAKHATKQ